MQIDLATKLDNKPLTERLLEISNPGTKVKSSSILVDVLMVYLTIVNPIILLNQKEIQEEREIKKKKENRDWMDGYTGYQIAQCPFPA